MIGQKFGRWTVVSDGGRNLRSQKFWFCECSCGTAKNVVEFRLKNGESQSCGCARDEATGQRVRTHGRAGTKIYNVWYSFICYFCSCYDDGAYDITNTNRIHDFRYNSSCSYLLCSEIRV